jgi:hypothetical protein
MKDDRIDLSSLAAQSDAQRWADMVDTTLQRVEDVLATRTTTIGAVDQLLLWTRPALALAALIMLLALPLIISQRSSIEVPPGADGMATISRLWATGGPQPSAAVLEAVVERSNQ